MNTNAKGTPMGITEQITRSCASIADAIEGTPVDLLTFNHLRTRNVIRCETAFHTLDSWSPCDWATAMAGECGEACNMVKKLRRLDDAKQLANIPTDREGIIRSIGDELADLVIYADLLAARLGIKLGKVVAEKFNAVSDRVGSTIKLECAEIA
jgi:NTP pyrophosphatase (non-canonical NTP hydrolase)